MWNVYKMAMTGYLLTAKDIGKEGDMEEIYAGEKAQAIRKKMAEGNYEDCNVDNCPWLANGVISEHLLDVEEVPKYPKELYLAYEGICNYHCTCCSSHGNMEQGNF